MEKRFSAALVLAIAIVFSIANGQCRDDVYQAGHPCKFSAGITPCDMAASSGIDCLVFVRCLEKFQQIKKLDPNGYYPGISFYVPWPNEIAVVKKEMGTVVLSAKAPAKKFVPISANWIRKRATQKQIKLYLLEKYTVKNGETIFSVALRYTNAHWKSPQTLVWFNPKLKNPEALKAGDILNIPDTTKYFWIKQDGAPYGNRDIAAAVMASSLLEEIKDSVLLLMQKDANGIDRGRDGYIKDGTILRQMAEGPSAQESDRQVKFASDVVCIFNGGDGYYARVYEVRTKDFLYVIYNPSVCHNLCWQVEPLILIPATNYNPHPPEDTTPIIVNTPATPVDSSSDTGWGAGPASPAEKEKSSLINNEELYAWAGHQCPLPYWTDGSNFYGGRFNWFPGSGVFGLNLELNGWDGYGTRVEWYRYFGFCPAGGVSLEWANSNSKFTIFADVAWQNDTGWNANYYGSDQKTWFAYPGLTYLFMTGKGCWDEGYIDYKKDVSHSKNRYDHGVKANDQPTDKSCIIFGNRYFFWNFATNTPLTLGVSTKVMHLWEDDRYEFTLGPVLSINYFLKVGIQYQWTRNSVNNLQNGDVVAAVADIDLWNIFKR